MLVVLCPEHSLGLIWIVIWYYKKLQFPKRTAMLLIDKNWLIRIWSDIKGAQDEIIRLLLNVSDCLHVFAWMKFHPRMYLSLSKRQGWNFIQEWKEKKKKVFWKLLLTQKKGSFFEWAKIFKTVFPKNSICDNFLKILK